MPVAAIAAAVPPVDRRVTPASDKARASSTMPALSETLSNAREILIASSLILNGGMQL